MSNQKITSLTPLPAADVITTDLFLIVDRDDPSAPTGETKNITVGDLAKVIASLITPGNTASQPVYQATHSFQVGSVIRMDSGSQCYVTASANSTTGLEAEVAGIVNAVADTDNFTLTVAGFVDFAVPPYWLPSSSSLEVGTTYFLAAAGALEAFDPSATTNPTWISKPFMVGVTPTLGIITNYRGFYQPGADTTAITTLYITETNTFVAGDAVRKTLTSETASLGNWTLASADTYQYAEVVGVVNAASSNYFSMILTGRITGLNNLEVGETYYLVPSASINYTSSVTPRNSVSVDQATCTQYSKPVFVAISSTDAVVVNQRAYPTVNSTTNLCGGNALSNPYTYGPMEYSSTTQPSNENIITFLTIILPNAANNSSANVYWIQPVVATFISSDRIVSYDAIKTEEGWFIS